jgi:hypothetical protein
MSDRPPNSDWLEQALASTRRRVRQVEIDACRIRTDLAQIEVANAAGIVDGSISAPLGDELSDTSQQTVMHVEALAPSLELPVFDDPVKTVAPDVGLDWQPAATPLPERMDILVSAPPPTDAPTHAESPPQAAAELVQESSTLTGLIGRSRRIYRRATSPVVASLVLHGAILFLAVSITVATIDRDDLRFSPTILDLGHEPAKERESLDPHQLADLGETGIHEALADLPKFDALASLDPPSTPIDLKSVDGPVSAGRVGLPDSIPNRVVPPGTIA